MSGGFGQVRPPGANVPGYLLPLSIAATILCCLPGGIVAIVYSVQARSKSQAGDYAGASRAARTANIWLIVSVVVGIVVIIIGFAFGIFNLILLGGATDQYSSVN